MTEQELAKRLLEEKTCDNCKRDTYSLIKNRCGELVHLKGTTDFRFFRFFTHFEEETCERWEIKL